MRGWSALTKLRPSFVYAEIPNEVAQIFYGLSSSGPFPFCQLECEHGVPGLSLHAENHGISPLKPAHEIWITIFISFFWKNSFQSQNIWNWLMQYINLLSSLSRARCLVGTSEEISKLQWRENFFFFKVVSDDLAPWIMKYLVLFSKNVYKIV